MSDRATGCTSMKVCFIIVSKHIGAKCNVIPSQIVSFVIRTFSAAFYPRKKTLFLRVNWYFSDSLLYCNWFPVLNFCCYTKFNRRPPFKGSQFALLIICVTRFCSTSNDVQIDIVTLLTSTSNLPLFRYYLIQETTVHRASV